MAVVSGKPILSWLIGDLKNKIKDIILATGHLSSNIEKYVGNEFHNSFKISKENKPLGTGGAIKNAEYLLKVKIF